MKTLLYDEAETLHIHFFDIDLLNILQCYCCASFRRPIMRKVEICIKLLLTVLTGSTGKM